LLAVGDAGTRVRVVRVEGARVIVEPIGALPDN
jgi:membrane protein implicated in regulation of membrane protease activity